MLNILILSKRRRDQTGSKEKGWTYQNPLDPSRDQKQVLAGMSYVPTPTLGSLLLSRLFMHQQVNDNFNNVNLIMSQILDPTLLQKNQLVQEPI